MGTPESQDLQRENWLLAYCYAVPYIIEIYECLLGLFYLKIILFILFKINHFILLLVSEARLLCYNHFRKTNGELTQQHSPCLISPKFPYLLSL